VASLKQIQILDLREREIMNINLIDHNDTEWERTIAITYQGKSYLINLSWSMYNGYEIKGFDKLPESLRNQYESKYDLASELDEATYNKAYNKEEINA
jgi:hypothetical protein